MDGSFSRSRSAGRDAFPSLSSSLPIVCLSRCQSSAIFIQLFQKNCLLRFAHPTLESKNDSRVGCPAIDHFYNRDIIHPNHRGVENDRIYPYFRYSPIRNNHRDRNISAFGPRLANRVSESQRNCFRHSFHWRSSLHSDLQLLGRPSYLELDR